MTSPRSRAAGVLGPGKLRQLEEAGLAVVSAERVEWSEGTREYVFGLGERLRQGCNLNHAEQCALYHLAMGRIDRREIRSPEEVAEHLRDYLDREITGNREDQEVVVRGIMEALGLEAGT